MTSLLAIATALTAMITAPGPLSGTLLQPSPSSPIVLIVPGSGPTDRDGNSPLGITAAPYRQLAEALANEGVATLRIDKRGMFGSKTAVPDANAVTIADYAADVHAWAKAIRARTGAACIWVLGHSEGGLVAVTAAQQREGVCGVILVAAPGRKLGDILRDQLRANPANAPIMGDALAAIAALERGDRIDVSGLHPALQTLFASPVQPYLIDTFAIDPARLAARTTAPMLIISGGRDLQVPVGDGAALAAAQPNAQHVVIPRMNHVLKAVASEDRNANLGTYADPSLPVAPQLVEAIAAFVKR